MTCSIERRLEIQLKDEREVFDAMQKALRRIRCPKDTDGDGNCGQKYCPYCGQDYQAALKLADAARPKGKKS